MDVTAGQLPHWFIFWLPISNIIVTVIFALSWRVFRLSLQWRLGEHTQLRVALFDRRLAVHDSMWRFLCGRGADDGQGSA